MIEPCHWPSKHIPNIEVRGEGGTTATMDFWVFDHFVHLLTKAGAFPIKFEVDSVSTKCMLSCLASTRFYVTSGFVVYNALCIPGPIDFANTRRPWHAAMMCSVCDSIRHIETHVVARHYRGHSGATQGPLQGPLRDHTGATGKNQHLAMSRFKDT